MKGRVLIVRATRSGDPLRDNLEEAGFEVLNIPVMSISPLGEESPEIKQIVLDIDQYRKAIFVSRHAARLGAEWIDRYWPMLPVGIQWFAVGESTAEVLRQQGIDAIHPAAEPSTEGLLLLPELQNVKDEKIIIFRGVGGREDLAAELRSRGADVEYCELYRREGDSTRGPAIARALHLGIDCLIVHSAGLLEHLLAVAGPARRDSLLQLPLVVPGDRVARIAAGQGFARVIRAKSALADDMVAAVTDWYTRRQIGE